MMILNILKLLFYYPYARSLGATHARAVCVVLHENQENWKLIEFSFGDADFYHSKHNVTCSKCNNERIANRIWMKAETWPANLGHTYDEALQLATDHKEPEVIQHE